MRSSAARHDVLERMTSGDAQGVAVVFADVETPTISFAARPAQPRPQRECHPCGGSSRLRPLSHPPQLSLSVHSDGLVGSRAGDMGKGREKQKTSIISTRVGVWVNRTPVME
jgi:hypothetical protein